MPTPSFYPPHPAEGRDADVFADYRAGHGWQSELPATQAAEPGVTMTTAGSRQADLRIHWLAYDPSSQSQYPVD